MIKKDLLLVIFIVLVSFLFSELSVYFGEIDSDAAGEFAEAVEESVTAENLGLQEDDPNNAVFVQVEEHQGLFPEDSGRSLVSVVVGLMSNEALQEVKQINITDFYTYFPIRTYVFNLNPAVEGFAELAVDQLLEQIKGFMSIVEYDPEKEYQLLCWAISTQMQMFGSDAVAWYLKPRIQGGAGQVIDSGSREHLARYMDFDAMDYSYHDNLYDVDVRYVISKVTTDNAIIWGTPMKDSYADGPLIITTINFNSRNIKSEQNPVYKNRF